MKGKIDKDGNLWIGRGPQQKLTRVSCMKTFAFFPNPANSNTTYVSTCCDGCSLFGEPDKAESPLSGKYLYTLEICEKTLFFTEFTDERD